MTFFSERHAEAIAAVDAWFTANFEGVRRAELGELMRSGFDATYTGWRISKDGGPDLLIALDRYFPYSVPRTAAPDELGLALAPHIEEDLRLCTVGTDAAVDPSDPAGVVREVVRQSFALIRQNMTDADEADFHLDFEAYWRRGLTAKTRVLGLLQLRPPCRIVSSWVGAKSSFLAEDQAALDRWLNHLHGASQNRKFVDAGFIWFDTLPSPAAYPTDVATLRELVAGIDGGRAVVDHVLQRSKQRRVILIAGPATDKRSAAGAIIIEDHVLESGPGKRQPINKGFRPGKLPPAIQGARSKFSLAEFDSVDEASTRLPPGIFEALAAKSVDIIGCGSLGAGVARILAQSGVGRMRLFDPQQLNWANIGRHELGANDVGQGKASTLAKRLLERLPHLVEVVGVDKGWLSAAGSRDDFFDQTDVICSFTGLWNAEAALNDFQRARGLTAPVVLGWLEREAVAAHGLALGATGPCLRCGFDNLGNPLSPATCWLNEETNDRCAGVSSPYGAMELGMAQSLCAGLVIDLLLDRAKPVIHRGWLGLSRDLERAGGGWSSSLLEAVGDPGLGGKLVALPWRQKEACTCN